MHSLSEAVRFLKCWKMFSLELNKTLLFSTNSGFYGSDWFGEKARRQEVDEGMCQNPVNVTRAIPTDEIKTIKCQICLVFPFLLLLGG